MPRTVNKEPKVVEQSGKKVTKSDEQWREQLSDEEFRVCREQGTEPPFSGKLLHNKETGVYACTCCNAPLFV
ncbi:peptide-methionine (R)-S-oxide reductase, partial [Vibrio parahaemolyticus]